jgi:leucyl-tRNA synthetase
VLVNSDVFDGTRSEDAREQVVAWLEEQNVGEGKTIYKIRDWSVSRQRYWGAPIPIVNCVKCGPVLVPENQLPVVLPELDDYAPSGDGRSALARATDWVKTDCPECGGQAERETDTLDTYICSSWYMLRYFDPANEDQIFDTDVANKWTPIDFYNGGDHATAHMIYARFVTRFLHKLGLLENPEPFKKFLYNGKVTAASGEMFSKRLGNGVDPLEIINQGYGADALRTYMMFAAPLEVWMKWNTKGVPGTYRFLSRVWNLTQDFLDAEATEGNIENVLKTIHPVILKVTKDIEDQKYNTAIAALMEVTNDLYSLKTKGFGDKTDWRFAVESLVMMVAPFAPHMAEELWQDLDHETSVNVDNWPKWDEKYLEQDTVTIAVQVNGKLRGEIEVAADASEEEVKSAALAQENVAKHLDNKKPTKVIYVPGRLVNVVA